MDKNELIKLIEGSESSHKKQILGWVRSLSGPTRSYKPSKFKKGDVFMHPVFIHPYVLLEKKDDLWLCGLLTSNGDFEQVLEQCSSRFFGTSYFAKVLFTVGEEPQGQFLAVYDNTTHLNKILKQLKEVMS